MLYKLQQTNGVFDALEAMPFKEVALEKHLEDLLAKSLLDVLFEGNKLMPIRQERRRQEEADIYALNEKGDLVIFELKRGGAGADAVHQALRYCEKASHWNFEKLQEMLVAYTDGKATNLQEEHQANFELEHPLEKFAFNGQQRLIVVGSAANDDLIRNVNYWKAKGLLIDFIPYRVYSIKNGEADEHYFEFFSIPYDQHSNPAKEKGVLFDTCRTYIPSSIWYMCENNRVAAFDDQRHVINYLGKNDVVFLYHKWIGIVAAGKVVGAVKQEEVVLDGKSLMSRYRELEWLTAIPSREEANPTGMTPGRIREVLNHNFFWARTIKSPYLSKEECDTLRNALIEVVGVKSGACRIPAP